MFPSAPVKIVDLFAFASAGSVTVGTAWFVVRLAKAIVPSVVGYLSRRRLLRTIEKLAARPGRPLQPVPTAVLARAASPGWHLDPPPVKRVS